jgi:hypothetical protein
MVFTILMNMIFFTVLMTGVLYGAEVNEISLTKSEDIPMKDVLHVEQMPPMEQDPVATQEPPMVNPEPEGIDTVSLEDPQGNWLFKKIWWERAENLYGKIRESVGSIWESRTTFFTQRNELDKKVLDPFYLSIGMGQGELDSILSELSDFFEKERERQGDLTEHERSLYDTLEQEKEGFEQLRFDVAAITQLDHALDDALNVLMEQINKARQLEKQAWESFREIAHVLNDIKARELYYIMDGVNKNIKSTHTYLERDFKSHFSRLIAEVKKHTDSIIARMQSLKEKGVDFKKRIQEDEEFSASQNEDTVATEEESKPKPKKMGWGSWLLSWPLSIWNFIVDLVSMPFSWLFGGKK